MIFGLVVIAAMTLSNSVNAQRVMNDPTYSEHNYKHPNKSAYMKKKHAEQPVVYLQEVKDESTQKEEQNSVASSANYKGMSASKAKTKKFVATSAPEAAPYFLAPAGSGNYKQQFAPRQKKDNKENGQSNEVPLANN